MAAIWLSENSIEHGQAEAAKHAVNQFRQGRYHVQVVPEVGSVPSYRFFDCANFYYSMCGYKLQVGIWVSPKTRPTYIHIPTSACSPFQCFLIADVYNCSHTNYKPSYISYHRTYVMKQSAYQKAWAKTARGRECIRLAIARYRFKHRDRLLQSLRASARKYHMRNKAEVFSHYGSAC